MKDAGYLTPEEIQALKETFRAQAEELLELYAQKVLELEKASAPAEVLKAIRRVVHTVKGDSMSLEFTKLAEISHRLEDVLEQVSRTGGRPGREQIDALLACGDRMGALLRAYCAESSPPPTSETDIGRLLERLAGGAPSVSQPGTAQGVYEISIRFARGCRMHSAGAYLIHRRLEALARIVETEPELDAASLAEASSWRLVVESTSDVEALKQAARVPGVTGRLSIAPLAAGAPTPVSVEAPADDLTAQETVPEPAEPVPHATEQLRVEVEKIDRVMDLVGELVIGRSMITQAIFEVSGALSPGVGRSRQARKTPSTAVTESALERLEGANHFLERILGELQAAVLKIRMVPVDRVFRRLPRMVRELAHDCGKRVELEIQGGSTEMDKSIVDALGEPLLHLIRNALDHGLESPEERRKVGKPEAGRVTIAAFYQGHHVHLVVEDDGRGIDVSEVADRAIALGLVTAEAAAGLAASDILNFIYRPGFSTRQQVSPLSGRGIGMDVVRQAIEILKGTVELETAPGRGTRFLIRLPLTLAILRSILVESAGKVFAAPLSEVLEIIQLRPEEARSILGRGVMLVRGRGVPLVRLDEILGLPQSAPVARRQFVLSIGEAERRAGLMVDNLLGEHELVVKPIEDPLPRSAAIAGASVLGDGRVVLILNLGALVEPVAEPVARQRVVGALGARVP
jgi:two-component system chemotaxis sensor kinase CheA